MRLVNKIILLSRDNEFRNNRVAEPPHFFRPELDALRLLAFLLVFVSHLIGSNASYQFQVLKQAGAFGVPVFFALSAYLITELLWREKQATRTVSLLAFYTRRVLRIWPLYFLALAACFLLSHVVPEVKPLTIRNLLPYLILCGNWPCTHGDLLPLGFGVLWSIAVEEQFYLVWPAMVRWSRNVLLWVLASIWTTSQIFVAVISFRSGSQPEVWYNTLTQMQYLAIGAGISLTLRGRIPRFSTSIRAAMIFMGLAIFVVLHRQDSATYVPYFAAGVGTCLLLLGMLGATIPTSFRFCCYLGQISYGLYIYHGLVLQVTITFVGHFFRHGGSAAGLVLLPLTVLIAHISYQRFEKPFLRLKEKFEFVKSRTA